MWLLLGLGLGASVGSAASLDAHGFRLGTFTPDPIVPLQLVSPGREAQHSFYLAGVAEWAESPLVAAYTDERGVVSLLDNVLAANLAGGWRATEAVRFNLSLPLYLASRGEGDVANGFALGDIRASVDATLVDGPLRVGVAPLLDLPTGNADAFLGQGGIAGGALFTAGVGEDRWRLTANVGPYFRPQLDLGNIQGADRLLAGAHVGYAVSESFGLNVEGRLEAPFSANAVRGTDLPTELLLFGHKVHEGGGHWMAGGSTAISPGASAAWYRVFVGGGFGRVPQPPPPPPPPEGGIEVSVYLDNALVLDVPTHVEGPTPVDFRSAERPFSHLHLVPGDTYVASAVRGPCEEGTGQAVVPENAVAPLRIDLVPKRSARVRLEIYDADNKPLHGGVVTWEREVTQCVPGEPLVLADTHEGRQSIGVGSHTVFVTVTGYNTYVETVSLVEGDDKLIVVRLLPTLVELKEDEIVILDKVYFEFDGDKVDPRSQQLLDEVANVLRAHPEVKKVEVGGHTDDRGKDIYNLDLSQRRVDSVRSYLIGKGVSEDRLVAKGYGETRPIEPNTTAEGRATNRRVEFDILERAEAAKGTIIRTIDDASDDEKKRGGKEAENRPDVEQIESGRGK